MEDSKDTNSLPTTFPQIDLQRKEALELRLTKRSSFSNDNTSPPKTSSQMIESVKSNQKFTQKKKNYKKKAHENLKKKKKF